MNKKMKIITISLCLLILTGCSPSSTMNESTDVVISNNAYLSIDMSDVIVMQGDGDINGDPSNPVEIYSKSYAIAIATIDSIDGGSNVIESTGKYTHPYTYGKLTIETVLKGDLTNGEQVNYVRSGGIVDYGSYYKSLSPAQQQKRDYLGASNRGYVKYVFGNDIDIEVGKKYLIYFNNPENGSLKNNSYQIIGWESGLREVNSTTTKEYSQSNGDILVLNNITNEWESLNSLIPYK
ncbi:hypothetical protein [Anaerorhabdus sp.]|uniref:hypothetical protein n=1 Tax=Anaerorhabdus sp. TaxID=1872524 RepID=UPI002FC687FE